MLSPNCEVTNMAERNLDLSPRVEMTREQRSNNIVHFNLQEIKNHFDENLIIVNNQFPIADELYAAGKIDECKAIWRSQVVFVEGFLDFFLHEISKYSLYNILKGDWAKTEKYEHFCIPMREVEKAIEATESKEWFFEYLNNRFSRDVFLSHESLRDQLNLIGIPFNDVMCKAFPKPAEKESCTYGKNVIIQLYNRRNEIAHQNDRNHGSGEQNDIGKDFVNEYISNVCKIVEAIYDIAKNK